MKDGNTKKDFMITTSSGKVSGRKLVIDEIKRQNPSRSRSTLMNMTNNELTAVLSEEMFKELTRATEKATNRASAKKLSERNRRNF
jgi:hypothetical protein